MTLTECKQTLEEIGLQPTKSLGQNFLIDQNILRIVVETAEVRPGDTVWEVGAGLGALTGALLQEGAHVMAVEKDARSTTFLRRRFRDDKNLTLIHGDALTIQFPPPAPGYKLVANLPYSISTAILKRFVESEQPPRKMVLMLQREVGERLAAKPGTPDYGVLTVFTQVNYRVSLRHIVKRRCFYPAPDVDSVIVALDYAPHPLLDRTDRARFADHVRTGFAQRRKQFAKLLTHSGLAREQIEQAFQALKFPLDVRAEKLSVEQFLLLARELSNG